MTTFRARTHHPSLMQGSVVTFMPEPPAGALPPPLPEAGTEIAVMLDCHGPDGQGHGRVTLVIETASRVELLGRVAGAGRFRLTPRRPSEDGGFWQPGRGMSEWVVREARRAEETPA